MPRHLCTNFDSKFGDNVKNLQVRSILTVLSTFFTGTKVV